MLKPFSVSYCFGDSTLGKVLLARNVQGVCALALADETSALMDELRRNFPVANLQVDVAQTYLAEVLQYIENPQMKLALPLDPQGTPFQQQVWQALRQIPCGQTLSYRALAQQLGKPQAVRAIASACAANKIALLIPCHRVVRSNGELSGYRWGVARKQALLLREKQA